MHHLSRSPISKAGETKPSLPKTTRTIYSMVLRRLELDRLDPRSPNHSLMEVSQILEMFGKILSQSKINFWTERHNEQLWHNIQEKSESINKLVTIATTLQKTLILENEVSGLENVFQNCLSRKSKPRGRSNISILQLLIVTFLGCIPSSNESSFERL